LKEINDQNLEIDYEWQDSDFIEIVTSQNALELSSAKSANKILICDTDSFATLVWYERYMNKLLPEIEEIHKEHTNNNNLTIYFLIDHQGKAFVQDGTRDGLHVRDWMLKRFYEKLREWDKYSFLIEGNYEETEDQVKKIIRKIFDI
jgi:nicotinamide riboside kinase